MGFLQVLLLANNFNSIIEMKKFEGGDWNWKKKTKLFSILPQGNNFNSIIVMKKFERGKSLNEEGFQFYPLGTILIPLMKW